MSEDENEKLRKVVDVIFSAISERDCDLMLNDLKLYGVCYSGNGKYIDINKVFNKPEMEKPND